MTISNLGQWRHLGYCHCGCQPGAALAVSSCCLFVNAACHGHREWGTRGKSLFEIRARIATTLLINHEVWGCLAFQIFRQNLSTDPGVSSNYRLSSASRRAFAIFTASSLGSYLVPTILVLWFFWSLWAYGRRAKSPWFGSSWGKASIKAY